MDLLYLLRNECALELAKIRLMPAKVGLEAAVLSALEDRMMWLLALEISPLMAKQGETSSSFPEIQVITSLQ